MSDQPLAIYDVYKFMNDKNIVLSFLGDFTHSVVTSLLSSVKKIIDTSEIDFQLKKRFYAVVVECLDNISRHNYGFTKDGIIHNSTLFLISEEEKHFTILTGNYVQNNQTALLAERIDKVNSLDRDELKALYRETIMQSPEEGGGLGIIDVSMRSGCKISYMFKPVSDEVSFFVLQTLVSK
jgi:hypothetical protein